eukprot:CAMPEP_0182437126 /NCGR_PEP_ID=MMETSP1167-20130531/84830_1 /TAXON_ID=2988 /ORGANISM="Mallomonas Sp, Strain CCMP3275" /LENGTH=722 /DNA_ID=CAMNT_0024629925 /DNA_START=292 /DNA_END=2457 /DNA_ORIENTATION=+
MELNIDDAARHALSSFERVRNALAAELNIAVDVSASIREPSRLKIQIAHAEDMMIAEADEVMHLAEEQLTEGLREDAAGNYHTATVYYRVLESMLPSMAAELHGRLMHAAYRTRECSRLLENYVIEHFDGVTCSDIYEVHGSSKLGKGSYGSVYLATHRMTTDERAVKVMNVDRVTSYYLRKLHTEIAILRRLDHPNIIRLHDVFFGRRSVYLVTELCRGGELFELLTSGKKQGFVFREDRASRLLRDMLSAVKYLHSQGVVHRDLKLENFLFEGESALSPLILIDFGLSKMFDPGEKIRQRVGSCYYTAPEVLNGAYDHRCDLWSLGVITYMLLSGCPPFVGKTPEEIHMSTLTHEPEFSERRFKHVSPVGIDFMRKLLIKDPERRMDSKEALSHPFIAGSTAGGGGGGSVSASELAVTGTGTIPSKSIREIVSSVRVYLAASRLTRVVLGLVAHVICADKVRHLREEFVALDTDHNGTLSPAELYNALCNPRCLRQSNWTPLSITEINALFASLSLDWNGKVLDLETELVEGIEMRYHEYIAAGMCRRVEVDEHRVRLAFEMLDTKKRGYLTANCLQSSLGMDLPPEMAAQIVAETDRNGDGEVRYSDFIGAWREALMTPRPLTHSVASLDDDEDMSIHTVRLSLDGQKNGSMAMELDTGDCSQGITDSPSVTTHTGNSASGGSESGSVCVPPPPPPSSTSITATATPSAQPACPTIFNW